MQMRKSYVKLSVLTILMLTLVSGITLPGTAQANSERGTLQVSGSAVVTGAPDIPTLHWA